MKKVKHNDFIGKTFGYFTVESIDEPLPTDKKKERKCVCKCVCGNIRRHNFSVLRRLTRQSCGCMRGHLISKIKAPNGALAKHSLYNIYLKMIKRCYKVDTPQYEDYGGRGIEICEEWLGDRYAFIRWAFSSGWKKGLQLDRRDNNLGYTPENCRFVTPRVNSLNRRNTIFVEYNGDTKTLSDWCTHFDLKYRAAYARYKKGESGDQLFRPSGIKI